ncbi:MAG: prepilin-type N-terminal cleavage/methylation domain-containing protein [Synergistaceae bacterium]|nr:prepilin-type N-terminal cleavage/methylation domain-containing protein [Synergistaceae bacterium]
MFYNNTQGQQYAKKGFTLVELLIVIIVIGILSAMMMISAGEIIATTTATTVISNLKNLKAAVTFWYIDNPDKIEKQSNNGAYLVKYNGHKSPVQEFWESREDKDYRDTSGFKAEVLRYMSNIPGVRASGSGYGTDKKSAAITSGAYRLNDNDGKNKRNQWFIGYVISDGKDGGNSTLKRKFAERAKSFGLLQTNNKNSAPYTNGDVVWMMILQL